MTREARITISLPTWKRPRLNALLEATGLRTQGDLVERALTVLEQQVATPASTTAARVEIGTAVRLRLSLLAADLGGDAETPIDNVEDCLVYLVEMMIELSRRV